MIIRPYTESDRERWSAYVDRHPESTNCHLLAWKDIIEQTYGHRNYYVLAEENSQIVGILPLIHIRSLLFGSALVSMPFLNYGGILADSPAIDEALLGEAIKIAEKLKVKNLELRQLRPLYRSELALLSKLSPPNDPMTQRPDDPTTRLSLSTNKVRMLLELPDSSELLLKLFKSKLRSQINRPIKEGMEGVVGGNELVEGFYAVFSENMRDLGSPVHSKRLFKNIIQHLQERAKIVVVNYHGRVVAAALIVIFKDVVEVPWASSLGQYNPLSPNMLLYWTMLKFASDAGYHFFDFGRSTRGEGTARFKEQWGAKSQKLFWYSDSRAKAGRFESVEQGDKRRKAEAFWRRLPLNVANVIGPKIRRGIPL